MMEHWRTRIWNSPGSIAMAAVTAIDSCRYSIGVLISTPLLHVPVKPVDFLRLVNQVSRNELKIWDANPLPLNSGKWRFCLGSPTKNTKKLRFLGGDGGDWKSWERFSHRWDMSCNHLPRMGSRHWHLQPKASRHWPGFNILEPPGDVSPIIHAWATGKKPVEVTLNHLLTKGWKQQVRMNNRLNTCKWHMSKYNIRNKKCTLYSKLMISMYRNKWNWLKKFPIFWAVPKPTPPPPLEQHPALWYGSPKSITPPRWIMMTWWWWMGFSWVFYIFLFFFWKAKIKSSQTYYLPYPSVGFGFWVHFFTKDLHPEIGAKLR